MPVPVTERCCSSSGSFLVQRGRRRPKCALEDWSPFVMLHFCGLFVFGSPSWLYWTILHNIVVNMCGHRLDFWLEIYKILWNDAQNTCTPPHTPPCCKPVPVQQSALQQTVDGWSQLNKHVKYDCWVLLPVALVFICTGKMQASILGSRFVIKNVSVLSHTFYFVMVKKVTVKDLKCGT